MSPKAMHWTGRIITILVVLFLIVDAGMKVVEAAVSVEGSAQLGWPEHYVQLIGILLMIFTVLYTIPKTAFIGAILLTGYLGGAIAVMMRMDIAYYFPLIFGILVWVGLFLRNAALRALLLSRTPL